MGWLGFVGVHVLKGEGDEIFFRYTYFELDILIDSERHSKRYVYLKIRL